MATEGIVGMTYEAIERAERAAREADTEAELTKKRLSREEEKRAERTRGKKQVHV